MTKLLSQGPRRHALAVLALLGLVVLLFPAAVFRGEVFYDRDIHLEWYSQVEAFVRSVAAGGWPVWDNSIAFGRPLLADPSAQVLYPPTWLNLLVLPWTYYTLFVVLHLTFSAAGLYFLALSLEISPAGALAAAALWATSGPLVSLVNVWHHFAGAAWIPWVFLAAHGALRTPRPSRAVLWGAVQAGQILAGSADMCAMTGLGILALALLHVDRREPWAEENRRLVLTGVLAALVAAALSAGVWLPALDVARRSSRWGLSETMRTYWSVPFAGSLQTLVPLFVKDLPFAPGVADAFFDGAAPFLSSLYLGMSSLALVGAALLPGRRKHAVLLVLLVLTSLGIALGRHAPLYGLAVAALPPLRILRYPMKAMILVSFGWALLAGIGFDRWSRPATREGGRPERAWLVVAGSVLLLAAATAAAALALARWPERFARELLDPAAAAAALALRPLARELGLAACLAAAAALLAFARSRGPRSRLAGAVALLALVDLYAAHRGLIPTAARELVAFPPPAVEALGPPDGTTRLYVYEYFLTPGSSRRYLNRDDPYVLRAVPPGMPLERAQVLSQRLYLFPPVAGRWGYLGSFDVDTRGLFPPEISELASLLRSVEGTPGHLRLLRLGAVGFVMALHRKGLEDLVPVKTLPSLFPEPIQVFRVPEPLSRTYVVGAWRVASGPEAEATLLDRSFDPAAEIVLPAGTPSRTGAPVHGESRIVDFKPDRVRLEATLDAPGYVVLVDAYDPGWRATVDGRPAAVDRANVAFRAVRAEAGRHVIELVYRPPAVVAGLAISGAAAAAALVGGLLAWRRTFG